MKKNILFLLVGLWVSSCQEKQSMIEYVGSKQKLNVNDTDAKGNPIQAIRLITHLPSTVYKGEQAIFKLTTSSPEHKIVQAYFDCSIDTTALIDTVTYQVNTCTKGLAVINDTIVVALKPQKVGEFEFPETIVAISKGNDKIFRYHTGSFQYKVIEKEE